jgi:hypothetical protein
MQKNETHPRFMAADSVIANRNHIIHRAMGSHKAIVIAIAQKGRWQTNLDQFLAGCMFQ